MKRFLAMFAVVAMIVSMFSGVVFAQELTEDDRTVEWAIEIDNDTITYVGGFYPITITGRAIDPDVGAVWDVDAPLYVYKDVSNENSEFPGEWGTPEYASGEYVSESGGWDSGADQTPGLGGSPMHVRTGKLDYRDELVDVVNAEVKDGFFSIQMLSEWGVGTYFVSADELDPNPVIEIGENPCGDFGMTYDKFTIMYATELIQPATLEWDYTDMPETIIIQGMFPNGDFEYDAADITIKYRKECCGSPTYFITAADYADESSFGFLFSGDDFPRTGTIGLYIKDALVFEGEVLPGEMEVSLTPDEAFRNLGWVAVTAEFNFDDMYLEYDDDVFENQSPAIGGWVIDNDYYSLRAYIDDGEMPKYDEMIKFNGNIKMVDQMIKNYKVDKGIMADATEDSYDITFVLLEKPDGSPMEDPNPDFDVESNSYPGWGSFVVQKGTVEVQINEPEDYNLMYWNEDPLKVGDNEFKFYRDATLNDDTDDDFHPIVVKNEDGFGGLFYYEVIFNGCGLEDETFTGNSDGGVDSDYEFYVAPTETGMVEVTINVYEDENWAECDGPTDVRDYTVDPVHTFTRELEVEGWNITVTPEVIDVESEVDITVTITDEDGNPINNAVITGASDQALVPGRPLFDGTITNVVGGVYVIEYNDENMHFDNVGTIDLHFWTDTNYETMYPTPGPVATPEVTLSEAIEVVGIEVHTVTSDTPVLLEGFTETINITPLDADGEVIYPDIIITYYDADDKATDGTYNNEGRVDLDDDGIKESIEIDVIPELDAVRAVIRVETDSAKAYGEVELEVVKPQVVMTKAVNLTAYIDTDFEFTVIDPRDGGLLDKPVWFEEGAHTAGFGTVAADEDDDIYTATITTDDVDFATAEDDEEDVTVELWMAGTGADVMMHEVVVLEPTLTSDPTEMIIGTASNLVLTYLDADGMPLEGYYVKLDGEELGDTDENGQIAYATVATATGALEFWADTDDGDDVECEVPVTVDLEAPTATLVEANGMATITISDNVRVQKAMVNGVLVDMFYPAPTVIHMLAQADQYYVQAIDQNFNYLMVTLEGASANMLVVTVGEDTGFGPAKMIEGTTMVPVRYAEELGAVVTWDDTAETVTYTINGGEVVITVQIGNIMATVNGVEMEMAVAPYLNAEERCMVPIRMIAQELGFTVNYQGGGVTYIQ